MSENTIAIGLIGMGKEPYTASMFDEQLAACDQASPVYLDIHSEGGSVFEGFRIFNSIKSWPGKVIARVNAAAFSIASYIAMACDEIEIVKNGFFMIHNPWSETSGDHAEHAKNAQLLAELRESMVESYSARTNLDPEKVASIMQEERYIGAKQAIEMGLADRVIDSESKAPARQLPQNKLPPVVFASLYGPTSGNSNPGLTKDQPMTKPEPVAATVKAIKAAYPKAQDSFIVKCMDDELSMEEVGEEYSKSMEEQNEELLAKVAAMEEENNDLKAKLAAMEEPDEEPVATATKTPGVTAVASVTPVGQGAVDDPSAKWDEAIDSFVAQGKSRQQAAILANRKFPGLRSQMVEAANA